MYPTSSTPTAFQDCTALVTSQRNMQKRSPKEDMEKRFQEDLEQVDTTRNETEAVASDQLSWRQAAAQRALLRGGTKSRSVSGVSGLSGASPKVFKEASGDCLSSVFTDQVLNLRHKRTESMRQYNGTTPSKYLQHYTVTLMPRTYTRDQLVSETFTNMQSLPNGLTTDTHVPAEVLADLPDVCS